MDTTKDNFRPCSQFASGHEAVIRTEKLTKRFGSFTAVDGISFSVAPGEIFGFLGANGAGKTTAMRMLCGLSKPTSGKGLVAGYDIARESEQVKRNIGYMSQKFSLYEDLKVWENIRLFGGIYGMKTDEIAAKTDSLLHTLGFEQERDALVRCRWDGNRNWPFRWRFSTSRRSFSSTSRPEESTPPHDGSFGN